MKNSGAIKPPLSKAAAALLHACKKAAADFEKCGFISLSSTQNNREVTKNEAALSQKAAIHARLHGVAYSPPELDLPGIVCFRSDQ